MKSYFGYIRVSTAKQGTQGVSLQEQRSAIEHYADRFGLEIAKWFEEQETAAKRGRPVFNRMLAQINAGKASGVIIHKIDRSARNLRDWSDLGEMMDGGIDVHFANESLDLSSRGGRLSADIQAVVAADYIRNLREETKKGIQGRLKQGLLPMPAPLGYLDQGRGRAKTIDPVKGPLVKKMFELYASGEYDLIGLGEEMYTLGLCTKRGQRVSRTTISRILRSPFYRGLIRLKSTGQVFDGTHKPLISKTLFDAVQQILDNRLSKKVNKHNFVFRRVVQCATCGLNLTGELQKSHVYYRCHSLTCGATCISEDDLEEHVLNSLEPLAIPAAERQYIDCILDKMTQDTRSQREEIIKSVRASIGKVQERLSNIADAYLDGILDKSLLQDKQKTLLMERRALEDRLVELQSRGDLLVRRLHEFVDSAAEMTSVFSISDPLIKQQLLRKVTARIVVDQKSVEITLGEPYALFASREQVRSMIPTGVTVFREETSNPADHSETPVVVAQNSYFESTDAGTGSSGCPHQAGLRTFSNLLHKLAELLSTKSDLQDSLAA